MSIRDKILARALVACLLTPQAWAAHWSFQSYGQELGLNNVSVRSMISDHQGFIWVATDAGLFRFDGDRFQEIKAVKRDGNVGLERALHISRDGQIWAGSTAGVRRVSGDQSFPVPGLGFELTRKQTLASDDEYLYVAAQEGLYRTRLDGKGAPTQVDSRPAAGVLQRSDGTILWGCGKNICSLTSGLKQEWAQGAGAENGPWEATAEDSRHGLWIRSETQLLYRPNAESSFSVAEGSTGLACTNMPSVIAARDGEVLVPSVSGLAICRSGRCRLYGPNNGLERLEVSHSIQDREGSIWLSYAGRGVSRWLGRSEWQGFGEHEGLTSPDIWKLARDRDGILWVGTARGLYRSKGATGELEFARVPVTPESLITCLRPGPGGDFWIGTLQKGSAGVLRLNPITGASAMIPVTREAAGRFAVMDVRFDRDGTGWFATTQGLYRLAANTTTFDLIAGTKGLHCRAVRRTPEGTYLATTRGLYVERGPMKKLLGIADGLKDVDLQSVEVSPSGGIWLTQTAAVGIGHLEFTAAGLKVTNYGKNQGLPTDTVYTQFFDRRGRHWIATDSGVAVLEDRRWNAFNMSDGLIWNDCNAGAYLIDDDGSIWIGTSSGLSHFQPSARLAAPVPNALITSVTRNGVRTEERDFDSSTYSLAIRFGLLAFRRDRPLFRYRLGTSAPWVETRNPEVRLAELPSGDYAFEVQGEAEPGVWTRTVSFPFRIRPPWYRTWTVEIGAAALLMWVAWSLWTSRERLMRQRRADLERAVTERTQDLVAATARAERTSKYKSEFLANMSHEVRTPLNGVIGLTELALELSRQPEVNEHLRIASQSAKGLLGLINDILDISKIESGKLTISPIAFEVRPLFAAVGAMIAGQAEAKKLRFDTDVAGAVPEWLMADDVRLRQVLVNLVGNAVKFTAQGSVSVRAHYGDGRLSVTVRDTGIGIPPDKLHHIFESFEQADSSTTRRFGGTGLGLSISRRLVVMMGGELTVSSEVGEGSTFSFSIPAAVARPRAGVVAPTAASSEALQILVAEDNKVNQHLMRSLLTKMGHRVVIAENGVEALSAIEKETFDLVLMDIQMPEMDGIEAVAKIRERETGTGRHLLVVALTARAMAGDRETLMLSGMDEYLEKPLQRPRLVAILDQISHAKRGGGKAESLGGSTTALDSGG